MKPSANEARESLESIAKSKRSVAINIRPPLWLNLICSGALGLMIFCSGMGTFEKDFGVWFWLTVCAALVMLSTVVYWAKHLQKRGVVLNLFPMSATGKMLALGQILFFILSISGASVLFKDGVSWAPAIAGILNAGVFGFLAHRYPNYEVVPAEQS